jgi:hypothetical protein
VNPASDLFVAMVALKRGEIALREGLGRVLHPQVFRRGTAAAVKTAWVSALEAIGVVHREIARAEKSNVVALADHRERTRQ